MGVFKKNRQTDVKHPANEKDSVNKHVVEADSYAIYKLISQIRNVSQAREYKYAEYDLMEADTIIGSALDMYSDDATQKDENDNKIFSVQCSDETLKKDLNAFPK